MIIPEESYNKIDRMIKVRESHGESWPWIEFKQPDMIMICSWCQANAPTEEKKKELAENNVKVVEMAKRLGLTETHGICKNCIEQANNEIDSYKNLNSLSDEEKNASILQWEKF